MPAPESVSPVETTAGTTDEFTFGAFSAPIKVTRSSRGGEGSSTPTTESSLKESKLDGHAKRGVTKSNSVGVGSSSESIRAATQAATLAAAEAKGIASGSDSTGNSAVGSGADPSGTTAPEGPSGGGGAWGSKRSFLDVVRTSDK